MIALALAVALAAEPARPQGYQLDAPFQIVQDGKVLLELPSAVVLPTPAFDKVDQEFVRLQKVEYEHVNEPGPMVWFAAGSIVGAIASAGLIVGIYLVTR